MLDSVGRRLHAALLPRSETRVAPDCKQNAAADHEPGANPQAEIARRFFARDGENKSQPDR